MATNPLSKDSLLRLAFLSLSKNSQRINHRNDVAALFTNACMLAVGFKLVGLGGNKFEPPSTADRPLALPLEWNTNSDFTFQYTHAQSSMNYIMKVLALGDKTMVVATSLEDDRTVTLDLSLRDVVPNSTYPVVLPFFSDERQLGDFLYRKNMISTSQIIDLGEMMKVGIIQKLMPGLRKAGYEESSPPGPQAPPQRGPPERDPNYDPLRADPASPPARPNPFDDGRISRPPPNRPTGDFPPPGFEDEHEMLRRPGFHPDAPHPFNIGHNDLYPPGLGPYDPLAGGPRYGGGGMHPTFDDPMFGGGRGRNTGGDLRAPPGARYDPVGPGDPFGDRNMYPSQRRGGGGGGGGGNSFNPFGGYGQGDFI